MVPPPSPWLVYLACQSPASPAAARGIPRDPAPGRIYSCASSSCLWGLRRRYSLRLGGSGWWHKGLERGRSLGVAKPEAEGANFGVRGGLHPPVRAVPISSEIPCGDKYLISYGRHSGSRLGGGGTVLSQCAWAGGMTVLMLVPRGPGESYRSFQRRLLPLSVWSLILPGAREIFPNESFSEIGLLYGKASVSVNQQFLMKNLRSENSQEAPALTSERLPSSEHITGIYGTLPWFIVLQ